MTIDVLPLPRLVRVGPSIVKRLATLRRELEESAELTKMQVPAALMLSDVCAALDLGPEERREVLGEKAEAAIVEWQDTPIKPTQRKAPRGTGRSKQEA